jgi:hypothetical protein
VVAVGKSSGSPALLIAWQMSGKLGAATIFHRNF